MSTRKDTKIIEDSVIGQENFGGREGTASTKEIAVRVSKAEMASLEAEKRQLETRLNEAREVLQCKVCLDRPVAAVFMPCAHLNACISCSASLTTCPLCRSPIHYAAPVIID
ncbi:hypothetical protein Pcinc_015764 [Petrolisthes cinctipes]|uniref:RING-type domain-containing protein n=1 Tax=Petrolisthes cinctipes TaxID=88211 RepID=A0AAE1KQ49_PETCI|nr:hypothetical protein Pcinc_015764 [Petrolisthes cinctipes]